MRRFDDLARFRPDDDASLVAASFACPVCLGLDDLDAELYAESDDPRMVCTCEACSVAWRVGLDAGQLLRLILHPPQRVHLRPAGDAAPWRRDAAGS